MDYGMVLLFGTLLLVIITSAWVSVDAQRIGMSKLWVSACFMAWIVAFPLYLLLRRQRLRLKRRMEL